MARRRSSCCVYESLVTVGFQSLCDLQNFANLARSNCISIRPSCGSDCSCALFTRYHFAVVVICPNKTKMG